MSRPTRTHAPGGVFHITARTQGKARWFSENIKDEIANTICKAALMVDIRLIAFTVLDNHLHIVVRQGSAPLGWYMHRVLQKAAFLVKRNLSVDGHVFGGRYWAGLCDDPLYFRQCVIYTHLNAFYAEMCSHPDDYKWSSHHLFTNSGRFQWNTGAFDDQEMLFYSDEVKTVDEARLNYCRLVDYWMKRERLPLGVKYADWSSDRVPPPTANSGDSHWYASYTGPKVVGVRTAALADIARTILRSIDTTVDLDQVRAAGRIRKLSAVRRELTAHLVARNYRKAAIARCLCISPAYVSAVASDIRRALEDHALGRS